MFYRNPSDTSQNPNEVVPFNNINFYGAKTSEYSQEGRMLTVDGVKKAVKYYNQKYSTNITIPYDPDFLEMGSEQAVTLGSVANSDEQLKKFTQEVRERAQKHQSQTKEDEYREAFIFGANSSHSTPVIYIKKGNEEAFLIADSINKEDNEELTNFLQNSPIPVYNIPGARQFDAFSCYSDAILVARDATARDEKGQYREPDLLAKLKNPKYCKETKREGVSNENAFDSSLPDGLLKTVQFYDYIPDLEDRKEPIGKAKSLKLFHDSHLEDALKSKTSGMRMPVSGYLRKKGFMLAQIIEIQYYIDEMEKVLRKSLDPDKRKEFVAEAKKILRPEKHGTKPVDDPHKALHSLAVKSVAMIKTPKFE